jgi:hypothetical protein
MPSVSSANVAAPEFPEEAEWINGDPLKLKDVRESGPLLVEFWDFARVNSLRTMPYMEQWHRRYAPLGATVLGVHSPGFSCSAHADEVRAAVARLGIARPVLVDNDYRVWHDYGNKGWPARYLWGPKSHIRFWHYGEGEYEATEIALQESLREFGYEGELPEPISALRPEDAPGAKLTPQTADIALPADIQRVVTTGSWSQGADWLVSGEPGATISADCDAGTAWAVLSGPEVEHSGCHELPIEHGRVTVTSRDAGLRVHGLQFTPRI